MNDRFQRLRNIAPKLSCLCPDPNARVHYELMSDGLVWSDELPAWDRLEEGEVGCLRGIWRFRSSLIMGAPEEKLRPHWEEAQRLFPNWPGFSADRQSDSWRELFLERQAKSIADWEALDERYERQKAKEKASRAETADSSFKGPGKSERGVARIPGTLE